MKSTAFLASLLKIEDPFRAGERTVRFDGHRVGLIEDERALSSRACGSDSATSGGQRTPQKIKIRHVTQTDRHV